MRQSKYSCHVWNIVAFTSRLREHAVHVSLTKYTYCAVYLFVLLRYNALQNRCQLYRAFCNSCSPMSHSTCITPAAVKRYTVFMSVLWVTHAAQDPFCCPWTGQLSNFWHALLKELMLNEIPKTHLGMYLLLLLWRQVLRLVDISHTVCMYVCISATCYICCSQGCVCQYNIFCEGSCSILCHHLIMLFRLSAV